ncbi:MAG: TIGR01620 family protein [Pseudomonadota bacterium]
MNGSPKGPVIIEVEAEALPDAPAPADAPPLADRVLGAGEQSASGRMITAAASSGGWTLGRLAIGLIVALAALWAGTSAVDFAVALLARSDWLGWIAVALLLGLAVVLMLICVREMAALARLGRIESLRERAMEAVDTGSTGAAAEVLSALNRLYRGRRDLQWGREKLETALADTPDGSGRLALAERNLMTQLDAEAEEVIVRTSRQVAAATALIPLALVDVLAALTGNLRMVREIAEIYGGRAGWFGSLRLMRAVAAHLVATGAVAVADDLLGPLIGGGVLGKLSRRFGEGAVNGALTARVGVAAIDICRPLPFIERDAPRASALALRALQAWRVTGESGA